jgi:hypothetical protein
MARRDGLALDDRDRVVREVDDPRGVGGRIRSDGLRTDQLSSLVATSEELQAKNYRGRILDQPDP